MIITTQSSMLTTTPSSMLTTTPSSMTPVYKTQHRRSWRQFDLERFRSDLAASCLCDGTLGPPSLGDASTAALWFDEVIAALLDAHAPMAEITCRVRPSSDRWYDSECRSAKRHARRLERCYKKTRSTAAREHWVEALGSMHRLVRSKRDATGGRKLTLDAIRRLFGVRLTKDWAGEELAPRIRPLVSQLRPS